jgi:hypothetical protein
MANMDIYERVKEVPKDAQKEIQAGRLKGMTDINPMWRIEKLTEVFGPCGIGWYTVITEQWIEEGANGERCAFVKINLFIKHDGEWSKPIEGVGGSSFIAAQKSGLYTSDECYKMAYTDAISVACKALGFGANIYWKKKNETKYDKVEEMAEKKIDKVTAITLVNTLKAQGFSDEDIGKSLAKYKVEKAEELTEVQYAEILLKLNKK